MRTDTETQEFENCFSYLIKYFVFASIDPFIKSFYPRFLFFQSWSLKFDIMNLQEQRENFCLSIPCQDQRYLRITSVSI